MRKHEVLKENESFLFGSTNMTYAQIVEYEKTHKVWWHYIDIDSHEEEELLLHTLRQLKAVNNDYKFNNRNAPIDRFYIAFKSMNAKRVVKAMSYLGYKMGVVVHYPKIDIYKTIIKCRRKKK